MAEGVELEDVTFIKVSPTTSIASGRFRVTWEDDISEARPFEVVVNIYSAEDDPLLVPKLQRTVAKALRSAAESTAEWG